MCAAAPRPQGVPTTIRPPDRRVRRFCGANHRGPYRRRAPEQRAKALLLLRAKRPTRRVLFLAPSRPARPGGRLARRQETATAGPPSVAAPAGHPSLARSSFASAKVAVLSGIQVQGRDLSSPTVQCSTDCWRSNRADRGSYNRDTRRTASRPVARRGVHGRRGSAGSSDRRCNCGTVPGPRGNCRGTARRESVDRSTGCSRR